MPISLPNFLQAETASYGPGDLLAGAIEGYKASRLPAQMKREEERQKELVQQLQHGNYKAGLENKYLPHKLQNEALTSDINLRYLGPEKQAGLESTQLSNRHQELVNGIMEATGLDAAQADVLLKQAQAKAAPFAHETTEQRNARAAGLQPGTPEYKNVMKNGLGIFDPPKDEQGNPIPVPAHAIPVGGKGLGERGHYETEMRKNIERGEYAKVANQKLNKIIELTKNNPRLNRSFSYIVTDPELNDKNTWKKAIRGLNENEQAQLELLTKYSNELVLAQDNASPGRGSDLRRKLIVASKPGVGMTDKARLEIAEDIKKQNEPLARYADEAAPFVGSYYIPYQAKNYQKNKEDKNLASLTEAPTQEQIDESRALEIGRKVLEAEKKNAGFMGTPYTKEQIEVAAQEEDRTVEEVVYELKELSQ